nr:MAG TPA: hypothetical protein [Caudoviricetes sp.]
MTHNTPHRNPLRGLTLAALGRVATMAALLALLALTATSCRQVHYITTNRTTHTTDTVERWHVRLDSVLVADSVALTRWQRGDTVYVEKTRLKIRNRVTLQHDTLWRTAIRHDTIVTTDKPKAGTGGGILQNQSKFPLKLLIVLAALVLLCLYVKKRKH